MRLSNMGLNFYVLEISAFILKLTETTNQIGDLKAKESTFLLCWSCLIQIFMPMQAQILSETDFLYS